MAQVEPAVAFAPCLISTSHLTVVPSDVPQQSLNNCGENNANLASDIPQLLPRHETVREDIRTDGTAPILIPSYHTKLAPMCFSIKRPKPIPTAGKMSEPRQLPSTNDAIRMQLRSHYPRMSWDEFQQLQMRAYARRCDGRVRDGKHRLIWTKELHDRFVTAVGSLGIKTAVPKSILQLLNVEGVSRENVASHLQKFRAWVRAANGLTDNVALEDYHLSPNNIEASRVCRKLCSLT